jgi:DNA-binding NarL/FixJ family response regulator
MRVLIATNEPVLARGFQTILADGGLEIVDVCSDIGRIVDSLAKHRPEIAILDMAVAPMQTVLIELRRIAPECQLLVWPRQISEHQAKELVRMGARGVLPNDVKPEVLLATLRMLGSFPALDPTPAALVKQVCDAQEREILSFLGHGMKNDEIAVLVRTDTRDIDQRVRNLARRLGVQDRYELALYGLSIANEGFPTKGEEVWKNEIVNAWH